MIEQDEKDMPISMDESARYVTQSGFYKSAMVLGPLTDRAIERYRKKGFYGPVAKEECKTQRAKRQKTAKPISLHKQVMAKFV